MQEIEQLQQQNRSTLILVGLNFVMFLILFFGLGYLIWQSSTLISKLEQDLQKVEQAVVLFQDRIQGADFDSLMTKVLDKTKVNMGESIKTAINQSDFGSSLHNMTEKIDTAQDKLERVGEAINVANEKLRKIDTEQLAQTVSYNILKGLGDGFTKAADNNKPSAMMNDKGGSPAAK
ncbi:hypothetical protein ACFL17_09280 [Pseudomonadota bacterium]